MVMLVSLFDGFTIVASSEDAPIKIGDYIQMGTAKTWGVSEKQPILWRCIAFDKIIGEDENGNPIVDPTQTVKTYQEGYLPLITNDLPIPILNKSFDKEGWNETSSHYRDEDRKYGYSGGSNYWGDSNIRDYLNSDEECVTYSCGIPASYNSNDPGFLTNFTNTEKKRCKIRYA